MASETANDAACANKRARREPADGETETVLPSSPAAFARFLDWVERKSGIAGLDNVALFRSREPGAGCGVYARDRALPPGADSVIRVPISAVLTAGKALASPVGRAAREVEPLCTDEFVLTLWVAAGRSDSAHPFHEYLASLQASGGAH